MKIYELFLTEGKEKLYECNFGNINLIQNWISSIHKRIGVSENIDTLEKYAIIPIPRVVFHSR